MTDILARLGICKCIELRNGITINPARYNLTYFSTSANMKPKRAKGRN